LGKGRIWNEVWCLLGTYWELEGGTNQGTFKTRDIGHLMRTLKELYGIHLGTPNFKTLFF
jgi:hypothetical protein